MISVGCHGRSLTQPPRSMAHRSRQHRFGRPPPKRQERPFFNVSLLKKLPSPLRRGNRSISPAELIQSCCNFSRQLRVVTQLQRGISVVSNGNIDVGNKTPTRKTGQLIVEGLAGTSGPSEPRIGATNPPGKERRRICGAMAQQSGDLGRGNQSAPQKLLRLVGCRDPKARPEPWVRPRPAPAKR